MYKYSKSHLILIKTKKELLDSSIVGNDVYPCIYNFNKNIWSGSIIKIIKSG